MRLALSSQGPSKSLQFQYYYPSLGFEGSCEQRAKHIKNLSKKSQWQYFNPHKVNIPLIFPCCTLQLTAFYLMALLALTG